MWHFRRTATCDVELHGQTIRAGDKVVVWFAVGQPRPRVFPDPHRFDVTRPPSRNLHAAFGRGGPHFCLGAHLAALEVRVLLEEFVPRVAVDRARRPAAARALELRERAKAMPVRVTLG